LSNLRKKCLIAALATGIGGAIALDARFVAAATMQKLSGARIQAKFAGMQLTDEVHYRLVYERNGTLRSVAMGVKKRGKWVIDKDQLCLYLQEPDDGCCGAFWQDLHTHAGRTGVVLGRHSPAYLRSTVRMKMSSQIVEKVSQEKVDFSNPVIRWIDYRLPIFTFLHHELNVYPTPRNLNYLWNFVSLAGIVLLIMIASGIVLAMHYVPTGEGAFKSVEHIMRDVNYGWLIRYIHTTGAVGADELLGRHRHYEFVLRHPPSRRQHRDMAMGRIHSGRSNAQSLLCVALPTAIRNRCSSGSASRRAEPLRL